MPIDWSGVILPSAVPVPRLLQASFRTPFDFNGYGGTTVTSRSVYANPSTNIPVTYESILYPTQVSGDPYFSYPVEVQARTTSPVCIPTAEADAITVNHAGADIQICWDATADSCAAGYKVLGSSAADSDAGYSVLSSQGLGTCWTGNPAQTYFLVTVTGTGGDGPWGHYGH